jgi:hypothetical protein
MKLEKIANEIKLMIAIILESIKSDFQKMDNKSEAKSKKQIIQMMQQLSSIMQKLNSIKSDDDIVINKANKAEDIKIIEDFLRNNTRS